MSANMIDLLLKSLGETCYMVLIAIVLATLIGLPLGVILTVTRKDHIMPNSVVHNVLGAIVNATRSTAIVPLTITAAPFIARVIESSLLEVDRGVIEAAQSMGASPVQIISKVMLPESLHSIVLGITLALIALIGASAMAGALGGGGLGDLAIRYGYQRFQMDVMIATVIVLIVMVQGVQTFGNALSRKLNKNKLS